MEDMLMRDVNAFRERFNYWKSTGELPYEAGLPKYEGGKTGNVYDQFAAQLGPYVYKYLSQSGIKNLDRAYMYAMKQLAYESNYGRSRVAREQHNYGGYGWNGKTYTTFKNDDEFAKAYSKLITSRYRKALEADTIQGYARGLKEKGYYEDTLENYSKNLASMKAVERAILNHRKNNADLYTISAAPSSTRVVESVPTAVEMIEAAPKWEPVGTSAFSYNPQTTRDNYTAEYLNTLNSFNNSTAFVPSSSAMLKNAINTLNDGQLYKPEQPQFLTTT